MSNAADLLETQRENLLRSLINRMHPDFYEHSPLGNIRIQEELIAFEKLISYASQQDREVIESLIDVVEELKTTRYPRETIKFLYSTLRDQLHNPEAVAKIFDEP